MFNPNKVRFSIRNIGPKGSQDTWALVCTYFGTDIEVILACGSLAFAKGAYFRVVKERGLVIEPVRKAFEERFNVA